MCAIVAVQTREICMIFGREPKEPSHTEIARGAYFRWLDEGSPQGREKQNWFAAETKIMRRDLLIRTTLLLRWLHSARIRYSKRKENEGSGDSYPLKANRPFETFFNPLTFLPVV